MQKKKLVLLIALFITITAMISSVFAQNFSDRLPNSFDDSFQQTWPGFSSNLTISNPVFNLNTSQASSSTPWSTQWNNSLNVVTYSGSAFATSSSSSFSPNISSTSSLSSLSLPWVDYRSNISTTQSGGFAGFLPIQTSGINMQNQVVGKDTIYSNINPFAAGIYALRDNATSGAVLDREVLGDNAMYTADGQKFYGTASYYNPYSSSHWFLPEQTTSVSSESTIVGGVVVGTETYTSVYVPPTVPSSIFSMLPAYSYGYNNPSAYPGVGGQIEPDILVDENELINSEQGVDADLVDDYSANNLGLSMP